MKTLNELKEETEKEIEELKKEITNILNYYGKEIEEVNRLRDIEPHDNPIYLYLEAQARLEGFKAGHTQGRQEVEREHAQNDNLLKIKYLNKFKQGQLAEREKFYYWLFDLKKGQKKWSTYQLIKIQKKLEELTQKINEVGK